MNFHDLKRVPRQWIADDLAALSDRYVHIRRAVSRCGIPHFTPRKANFHTLVALIVEQQISVRAARAILLRLEDYLPSMTPDEILRSKDQDLRSVGLSSQKVNYLRDLSAHVADGRLDIAAMRKMDDAAIEAHLTRVKGIGRWSAENFMIFALERRNIWPAGDIILQEGMRKIKKLADRPNIKQTDIIGARYAPYRTAMALLGWHFHEGTKFLAK